MSMDCLVLTVAQLLGDIILGHDVIDIKWYLLRWTQELGQTSLRVIMSYDLNR